MENISAPPYPGPPLQSTSSVDQRNHTPQAAPRRCYNIVEQCPGSEHQRSLPMETIPVPPYPGPPLESHYTGSVQQRPCSPQPPTRTCYSTVEPSPGHQHQRSLPMENIPVPPYPGPPLESQSTSSVQQRPYSPQPLTRTCYSTVEPSPGHQHQRSLPVENIPVPPYPGPPLESHCTGSVQQRPCSPQPPTRTCYSTVEQSPGPQIYRPLPVENFPVPPYSLDSQQRPSSLQPPPHACYTTVEHGAYNHQSPGPQHHSSVPKENIPVPQYPGPPLNSQSTRSVQERAYTSQPDFHTHHGPLEVDPHAPLHSPAPQRQSSLPLDKIFASQCPGSPLDRNSQQFYSKPAPHTPCKNAEIHSQYPGSSGTFRPVCKGAVIHKLAPHTCHDDAEGVSCQDQYCNHIPYSAPNKHSAECMDKKQKAQEFELQDVPHKHCHNMQGAQFPVDFPTERKEFCMKAMSESLNIGASQVHKGGAHAYNLQLQHHCSSEKRTIEISTKQQVKVSTNSGPPPPFPGVDLNLQLPELLNQLQPDTSASMYTYNHSNVVQPGFQVVQARESQMVIQPQRQTVVMPAPQPAMMIQPAAPSVRVIQAPAPPVQVIQAPAPAVHVIQAPAPTVRVIQAPAPAVQVVQAASPAVRIIKSLSNAMVYPRYY